MLDMTDIRERMRDRKISTVAAAIGIHKVTLYRLLNHDSSPSYETVKALSDYLLGEGKWKKKDGEG
jgi:DNA-binding phage protein